MLHLWRCISPYYLCALVRSQTICNYFIDTLIQIVISKVVNVFFPQNNDEILKDLTVTAEISGIRRWTCTCPGRTGTSVITWGREGTVNYKEERKYPQI